MTLFCEINGYDFVLKRTDTGDVISRYEDCAGKHTLIGFSIDFAKVIYLTCDVRHGLAPPTITVRDIKTGECDRMFTDHNPQHESLNAVLNKSALVVFLGGRGSLSAHHICYEQQLFHYEGLFDSPEWVGSLTLDKGEEILVAESKNYRREFGLAGIVPSSSLF
jgi:hypothetical protein